MDDIFFDHDKIKDSLTGCYKKEDLVPFLCRLKSSVDKENGCFSIMHIDINHFKKYIKTHGNWCQDKILQHFSSLLLADVNRQGGFVFRSEGDEFIGVFPLKRAEEVQKIGCSLKEVISGVPLAAEGHALKLTFSAGIASYPNDGLSVEELIKHAEAALYVAKRDGRARILLYRRKVPLLKRMVIVSVVLLGAIVPIFLFLNVDLSLLKGKFTVFQRKKLQKGDSVILSLKSGKLTKGVLIRESDTTVTLRKQTNSGEIILKYKKADIKKIESSETF